MKDQQRCIVGLNMDMINSGVQGRKCDCSVLTVVEFSLLNGGVDAGIIVPFSCITRSRT